MERTRPRQRSFVFAIGKLLEGEAFVFVGLGDAVGPRRVIVTPLSGAPVASLTPRHLGGRFGIGGIGH